MEAKDRDENETRQKSNLQYLVSKELAIEGRHTHTQWRVYTGVTEKSDTVMNRNKQAKRETSFIHTFGVINVREEGIWEICSQTC